MIFKRIIKQVVILLVTLNNLPAQIEFKESIKIDTLEGYFVIGSYSLFNSEAKFKNVTPLYSIKNLGQHNLLFVDTNTLSCEIIISTIFTNNIGVPYLKCCADSLKSINIEDLTRGRFGAYVYRYFKALKRKFYLNICLKNNSKIRLPIVYGQIAVIYYGKDKCVEFIKNGKSSIVEVEMKAAYLYKILSFSVMY